MTTTTSPSATYADLAVEALAEHPANLRFDLGDVSALAASIKANGLIEPVVVAPLADGTGHRIIAGHRRVAACRAIARDTVPAIIRPDLATEQDTTSAEHLFVMLDENTQREDLTADEVAAGLAQLAAFPELTAAKVAKRAGVPVEQVKTAAGAANLPEDVRRHVIADSLTLEQAAQLATFEDDPKAYARIMKKLDRGTYGAGSAYYVLSEEVTKRETKALKADATATLRDKGVKIVAAPDRWDFPRRTRMQPVSNLRTGSDRKISASAHAKCPGHAAFLVIDAARSGDARVKVEYVCTDPEDHGHALAEDHPRRDSAPTLTEQEQAEAAERAEATQIEWAAAGDARWAWLVSVLAAKQLPATLARASLARDALGTGWKAHPADLLHLLTGKRPTPTDDQYADMDRASAVYARLLAREPVARLHRHTVAHYAATHEKRAHGYDLSVPDTWKGRQVADWLRLTQSCGHELTPVERATAKAFPAPPANDGDQDAGET